MTWGVLTVGRSSLGWLKLALVLSVVPVLLAAPASARHNFSMLTVEPEVAAPGEEVVVSGFSYPPETTVLIRFDDLDGPVLAELEPTSNDDIEGTVTIPADADPGRYVLYALQYGDDGTPNRIPGRAALTVSSPGATPASASTALDVEARSASLLRSEGPGAGELAAVALGSLALAGALSLILTRSLRRRAVVPPDGEGS